MTTPSKLPTMTKRDDKSLIKRIIKAFEAVGLLNNGSAESPATPSTDQAANTAGVNTNTLNATRVGGLAMIVTSVGVAAMGIFSVNKGEDPNGVVMAAYISVGVIVATALLTAGLIIIADIRSRVALSNRTPAVGTPATTPAASTSATPPARALVQAWRQVVDDFKEILVHIQGHPNRVSAALLDVSASVRWVADLTPATELQSLHDWLKGSHALFLERVKEFVDESDDSRQNTALSDLQDLVRSMEASLQHRM